jgi:CRP-like cAMP-binding protein
MEAIADNASSLLRETSLFSAWPEALLNTLLTQSKKVTLGSGDILFVEKATANAFYLVLSGRIHLIAAAATGQEKIVEIIQINDLFAEAVAFLGGCYPVTAAADGPTTVLEIPLALFLEILEQKPQLMRQMLARPQYAPAFSGQGAAPSECGVGGAALGQLSAGVVSGSQ